MRRLLPSQGYVFNEHATHGPPDKIFEEAAFLERFRGLLVMEDGPNLWLAHATPRVWLEQGRKISVKNASTHFGTVDFEITSDVKLFPEACNLAKQKKLCVVSGLHSRYHTGYQELMKRIHDVAIMGQISCYTGKEVTWEQINQSDFYFPPKPEDCHDNMEPPTKPGPDGSYPVFDAGSTEQPVAAGVSPAAPLSTGRPDFVMERVRGIKITDAGSRKIWDGGNTPWHPHRFRRMVTAR